MARRNYNTGEFRGCAMCGKSLNNTQKKYCCKDCYVLDRLGWLKSDKGGGTVAYSKKGKAV